MYLEITFPRKKKGQKRKESDKGTHCILGSDPKSNTLKAMETGSLAAVHTGVVLACQRTRQPKEPKAGQSGSVQYRRLNASKAPGNLVSSVHHPDLKL